MWAIAHQGAGLPGRLPPGRGGGTAVARTDRGPGHDRDVYVTMINGTHTDSLGPDTISRWLEFLDIYVAGRGPDRVSDCSAPLASSCLLQPHRRGEVGCRPRRSASPSAPSVAAAKAAFAAQDPRVRVLFDNGGGQPRPRGAPADLPAGFSPGHRPEPSTRTASARTAPSRRVAGDRQPGLLPAQPGRPTG